MRAITKTRWHQDLDILAPINAATPALQLHAHHRINQQAEPPPPCVVYARQRAVRKDSPGLGIRLAAALLSACALRTGMHVTATSAAASGPHAFALGVVHRWVVWDHHLQQQAQQRGVSLSFAYVSLRMTKDATRAGKQAVSAPTPPPCQCPPSQATQLPHPLVPPRSRCACQRATG